jgi:hypothetical protein
LVLNAPVSVAPREREGESERERVIERGTARERERKSPLSGKTCHKVPRGGGRGYWGLPLTLGSEWERVESRERVGGAGVLRVDC